MNFSAKMVVVIAIGAALYGIGGLPMFGIPVFANTTLKPAMVSIGSVFRYVWTYRRLFGWIHLPLGNRLICWLGRVDYVGVRFWNRWFGYGVVPCSDSRTTKAR